MQTIRFPYHTKLTEYFRRQKKTWDWFSQKDIQQGQLDEYKKEKSIETKCFYTGSTYG